VLAFVPVPSVTKPCEAHNFFPHHFALVVAISGPGERRQKWKAWVRFGVQKQKKKQEHQIAVVEAEADARAKGVEEWESEHRDSEPQKWKHLEGES